MCGHNKEFSTLIVVLILWCCTQAQTPPPPVGMPRSMDLLEGGGRIQGTWTWNGQQYDSIYATGNRGNATIGGISATGITMHRVDTYAPAGFSGLNSDYTGTMDDPTHAHGTVVYTLGNRHPWSGTWTATFHDIESVPQNPPANPTPKPAVPHPTDPVTAACPNYSALPKDIDAFKAWQKGKDFAGIEGDGPFGIGNMGHTVEALAWYCKAAAAGNAAAAYEIGKIFEKGYTINTVQPDGKIKTTSVNTDLPTAIYWYQVAADRKPTKAEMELAYAYAMGDKYARGNLLSKNPQRALKYLDLAAEGGDTYALQAAYDVYSHRPPSVEGGYNIFSPPNDASDSDKARAALKSLDRISGLHMLECNYPEIRANMLLKLPAGIDGDLVKEGHLARVSPDEIQCLIRLSEDESRKPRSRSSGLSRMVSAGVLKYWSFTITRRHNAETWDDFRGERSDEAVIETMLQMQIAIEKLDAARPNTSPK